MKKTYIIWLVLSVVIMFLLPWLAVTFVKGDAGMTASFLMLYVINPLYSIVVGIFAGKNIKKMWSLPIVSAVIFLLGTWAFLDMGELTFLIYALVYLVIGTMAMSVSALIANKTQR